MAQQKPTWGSFYPTGRDNTESCNSIELMGRRCSNGWPPQIHTTCEYTYFGTASRCHTFSLQLNWMNCRVLYWVEKRKLNKAICSLHCIVSHHPLTFTDHWITSSWGAGCFFSLHHPLVDVRFRPYSNTGQPNPSSKKKKGREKITNTWSYISSLKQQSKDQELLIQP